jgi:hypothetical protein
MYKIHTYTYTYKHIHLFLILPRNLMAEVWRFSLNSLTDSTQSIQIDGPAESNWKNVEVVGVSSSSFLRHILGGDSCFPSHGGVAYTTHNYTSQWSWQNLFLISFSIYCFKISSSMCSVNAWIYHCCWIKSQNPKVQGLAILLRNKIAFKWTFDHRISSKQIKKKSLNLEKSH